MASPTQMVVGKGIPNLLIAEGLLKILRSRIPLQNPLPILSHRMVGLQKYLRPFPRHNEHILVMLTANL